MLNKMLRATVITALLSILMYSGFIDVQPSHLMADQQPPQAVVKLSLP